VDPPEPPKAKIPLVKTPPPRAAVRTETTTLDIRGQRVGQMETALEAAIQRALNAGILWIIHGKGTGKLRQGVQDFLTLHPQVERFELAPQNEGGAGVTIAYLQ
ncbi:Smr/MutS family protein, partial [Spirulina sp. CCNP1310]|uniref:Smr/MutS family protein n=1 Tax=Spirulina sp. CCNP1310 TaxID=3110249 RepID=UPI002B1FA8FD